MHFILWIVTSISLLSFSCSAEKPALDRRSATEQQQSGADALKDSDAKKIKDNKKVTNKTEVDTDGTDPSGSGENEINVDIDTLIKMMPKSGSDMEVFPPGVRVGKESGEKSQVGKGYADSASGAPGDGAEGILSCPTVDLPVYTGSDVASPVVSSLSAKYQQFCAGCHGATADGSGVYPTLKGVSKAEFMKIVRSGKGTMPKYATSSISEVELEALYEGISTDAKTLSSSNVSPYLWSSEDYTTAKTVGLQAWRKPDKDGIACANCHSPDAIDLAIIG